MRRSNRHIRALVGWHRLGLTVAIVAALLAPTAALLTPPATHAQTRDPVLEFLQAVVATQDEFVVVEGDRVSVVDPANDQTNPTGVPPITSVPQNDILAEEHLSLDPTAGGLLLDLFACDDAAGTICSNFGSDPAAFSQGMVLLYQGLAGDPRLRDAGQPHEWAILGRDPDFPTPPVETERPNDPFAGAVSHVWRIGMGADDAELELQIFADGQFATFRTHARAVLTADGIFWLIPIAQEWDQITGYDVYAQAGGVDATGFDTLRQPPVQSATMLPVTPGPLVRFTAEPPPSPTPTPAPTAEPTPSPSPVPSLEATAAPTAVATPGTTPEPDDTTSSGSDGFPWQILLLLGGILAVIALGLRFRRLRAPVEPAEATEPAEAIAPAATVAAACTDGDEEWRDDAPPGDFLVVDPTQKVRIAIEPVAPTLEAWLDAFDEPRGIPIDAFVGIDDDAISRLLEGLPTSPSPIEGEFVIPLLLRELQCQRRWVCRDGAWVSTEERRMAEEAPSPVPRTFRVDGPDRTVDDVIGTWREAVAALREAEAQVADADRYRADCG